MGSVWGHARGREIIFPTAFPGPPVHFTHQTLTISSFGYLLWRNKRHCYPFYYSKKKKSARGFELTHPENKQCNAVLHVALPTAPRAVDGSKGGLTNLYLGLNHPRWIGCMQLSTRGLWLAVCKWVRTGVRNCSGINNLAHGPRTTMWPQTPQKANFVRSLRTSHGPRSRIRPSNFHGPVTHP